MCEHFILHERGIVEDEDLFDGERGDLGEEDAAEGIGDGGVNADEREGRVERFELVKGDAQTLRLSVLDFGDFDKDSCCMLHVACGM